MKATLWKLIHKWRDATTTETAWIARDQIDIELDKIELETRQHPVGMKAENTALGHPIVWWADVPVGSPLFLAAGAQERKPLSDFDVRGMCADNLLCWHRLTEAETDNLIEFVSGIKEQS